jgi:hypothetical protein
MIFSHPKSSKHDINSNAEISHLSPEKSAKIFANLMGERVKMLAAQGVLTYCTTRPLPYPHTPTRASCLSLALL